MKSNYAVSLFVAIALIVSSNSTAQERSGRPFWRPVVMGTHGMVVAEHPLEAIVGMRCRIVNR